MKLKRRPKPISRSKTQPKLRVLIAEDRPVLREHLYKLLKEDFEIVRAVTNGRELVSAALELLPGAIVSDTSMPLLGGLGAMRELNATGKKIPLILIGAVFRQTGISVHPGAAAYVDKSDLDVDLVAAVRSAVAGHFFLSRSIRATTS